MRIGKSFYKSPFQRQRKMIQKIIYIFQYQQNAYISIYTCYKIIDIFNLSLIVVSSSRQFGFILQLLLILQPILLQTLIIEQNPRKLRFSNIQKSNQQNFSYLNSQEDQIIFSTKPKIMYCIPKFWHPNLISIFPQFSYLKVANLLFFFIKKTFVQPIFNQLQTKLFFKGRNFRKPLKFFNKHLLTYLKTYISQPTSKKGYLFIKYCPIIKYQKNIFPIFPVFIHTFWTYLSMKGIFLQERKEFRILKIFFYEFYDDGFCIDQNSLFLQTVKEP